MNKLLLPLATSLLLSTPLAFAASTTELKVKGTITPSACDITMPGGNVIDHGKYSSGDLDRTERTMIGYHILHVNVKCDAATTFALKTIDNQPGSSIYKENFGLGFINGDQQLGDYSLTLQNPSADDVQVQTIVSHDQGATWEGDRFMTPGLYVSVGAMDDDTQPVPTEKLTLELLVVTIINPRDGLGLDDEVPIDGSATIEVMYL